MNAALLLIWVIALGWMTRKNPTDKPGIATVKRLSRWFLTFTLVGAIAVAGFALLCLNTIPTSAPAAQHDTVFDRGISYD